MKSYSFIESGSDAQVDELYLKIKNTFGINFVPNFFKMIASHKDVLNGIWSGYANILASGELPLQIKEVIFLFVALEKGCNYCSSTHLAVCDMLEVTSENIKNIKDDLEVVRPEELKAVLMFVKKVVHFPGNVGGEDYQALRDMNFSDSEVSEIHCMVILAHSAVCIALANQLDEVESEISVYLDDHELETGLGC